MPAAKKHPLSILLLALLTTSLHAAEPQYSVTDLGPIGYVSSEFSFSQSQVLRVNDAGMVIGSTAVDNVQQASVYEVGQTDFIVLPNDGSSAASGLNASGAIVGWSMQGGERIAALWTKVADNWQLNSLALPNDYTASQAWDINDNGIIVGSLHRDDNKYAAYWPNAGAQPVLINSDSVGEAFAINNSGEISGINGVNCWDCTADGFRWQIGATDITPLQHISNSTGTGSNSWGGADINENGVIVGGSGTLTGNTFRTWSITHPFANTPGIGTEDLHSNYLSTAWAHAINDANYVVGETIAMQKIQTTLWPDEGDVTGRIPFIYRQETDNDGNTSWVDYPLWNQVSAEDRASWHFYKASGISDVGRIVGLGGKHNGSHYAWHAYMLTPAVADLSLEQSISAPAPSGKAVASKASTTNLSSEVQTESNSRLILRVTNHGPLAASDVALSSELPASLTINSILADGGVCESSLDANNNTLLNCQFSSLAVNASLNVIVDFNATEAGDFDIITSAAANELDSLNNGNNQHSKAINVQKTIASESPEDSTSNPQQPGSDEDEQRNDTFFSFISPWLLLMFTFIAFARLRKQNY
jgi:hypothetical protein